MDSAVTLSKSFAIWMPRTAHALWTVSPKPHGSSTSYSTYHLPHLIMTKLMMKERGMDYSMSNFKNEY